MARQHRWRGEIYHLHDGTIVDALVEAEARGVEVRIVLEDGAWWTGGQASDRDRNQQAAAELLAAGGAEVLWMVAPEDRTDPYRNMHSKALVRDGESSFISSGNLKSTSLPSDGSGNREWSMIVDNVTFAQQLQKVLEWDLDPNRPHLRALVEQRWTRPHNDPHGLHLPEHRFRTQSLAQGIGSS